MSNNNELIDAIIDEEGQYEILIFSKSPLASRLELAANDIKDFIRKKGLIITGGTAIDFALRLKGDKIYSDDTLVFPDLDFYSPNHVKDAYEIADMLYNKGYGLDKASFEDMFLAESNSETRAKAEDGTREQLEKKSEVQAYEIYAHIARHTTTMRVKLHSYEIADITYIPINLFDKLPFIMYDGMKIIHPHWQYMNMHHSLSLPLDNPPFEVLFHRMNKDVDRFSKLYSYYPIPDKQVQMNVVKLPLKDYAPDNVLYGFAAYAVIYNIYSKLVPHLLSGIPALTIDATHFTSPIARVDYLVIKKPDDLPATFESYNPYIDYQLPLYKEVTSEMQTFIHIINDSFVPIEYRTISGRRYSVPSAQFLLLFMLFGYHISEDYKDIYASFYNGLLKMLHGVNHLVERLSKDDANNDKLQTVVLSSPFYIPTKLYGERNISDSTEIILLRVANDLRRILAIKPGANPYTPFNYYPDRKHAHPEFDYTMSKYFAIDGEKAMAIDGEKASIEPDLLLDSSPTIELDESVTSKPATNNE